MNSAIKICSLALTLVVAVSAQEGGYGNNGVAGGYGHHEEYFHHPKYSYNYGVHDDKTHDIKKHTETRDGDKTEGEYSFLEADGTTRTVKYTVNGKSGFVATVHRSGHANHPQAVHQQPQVVHQQPQVVHHQPQVAHHQPQVVHHQPQVVHHQPQVVHQQPAYHYGGYQQQQARY